MKKYLILAASAVLVLAACAKVETIKNDVPEAINFGVYAGNAASKAVSATDFNSLTTALLQSSTNGFGVFAYYTDDATYASSTKANFMYNQQVKYSSGAWSYSPIKYWPNEHGTSAKSAGVDRLTFLAYAPYVANFDLDNDNGESIKDNQTPAAAATEGIIAMTKNNVAGDATLTFQVPASAENQIDLLYGTLGAKSVNVDGTEEGTVGGPIKDLTKQQTNGKVNILFKHALSKVAINIKDVVDQEDPTSTIDPDAGTAGKFTKVFVESVTLKGTDLGTKGKLNLYTGAWSDETKATSFSVTPLPSDIYAAAPTTYLDKPGVQETGLAQTIDLMLVPVHGSTSKIDRVDIVYYVCTKDDNLDGGVSVVKNTIYKEGLNIAIAQGKQYNLNILLGLTSVDVTADVEPWDVITPDVDVNLPQNVTPAP